MRRVRIVESLKYGGRMFAYLLGVVVLGGGGIALGTAVGWNSVTIRGTGGDPVVYSVPELIAGVVLVVLGGTVLFTGLLGFTYKLIADSTAVGVVAASGPGEFDVFDTVSVDHGTGVGDGSPRSATPAEDGPAHSGATSGRAAGGTAAGAHPGSGQQASTGTDSADERTTDPPLSGDGDGSTATASTDASGRGDGAATADTEPTTPGEPPVEAPPDRDPPGPAAGSSPDGPESGPHETAGDTREPESPGQGGADTERVGSDPVESSEPQARNAGPHGTPGAESGAEPEPTEEGEAGDTEKERTAEQIAFGVEESEGGSGPDGEPEDASGPGEASDRAADAETEQEGDEPTIFTDDRAAMGGDDSAAEPDDESALFDEEEAEPDSGEAGGDDEDAVVPEYDEISSEEPDDTGESESDDPLGNPFE